MFKRLFRTYAVGDVLYYAGDKNFGIEIISCLGYNRYVVKPFSDYDRIPRCIKVYTRWELKDYV